MFVPSDLLYRASLVAQMVKNLPAMQEVQVQSLGWEDSLEKGMETHSSILAPPPKKGKRKAKEKRKDISV